MKKQIPINTFALELERLGFETTIVNPDWDPEKDKRGLPGLEVLEKADVGIFFVRFLQLEDEQLGHITKFIESGKLDPLKPGRTNAPDKNP